ncbi:hypothetical protein B7486_20125 [cyanobacterium TDX16]|nr:hypothetical protein B7486_20125 [cyanobacterium TDX16]
MKWREPRSQLATARTWSKISSIEESAPRPRKGNQDALDDRQPNDKPYLQIVGPVSLKNRAKLTLPQSLPATSVGTIPEGLVSPYVTLELDA